jgi:hypothetical protein
MSASGFQMLFTSLLHVSPTAKRLVVFLRCEMSFLAPSRHFGKMRNFVAIGAKRTWQNLPFAHRCRE